MDRARINTQGALGRTYWAWYHTITRIEMLNLQQFKWTVFERAPTEYKLAAARIVQMVLKLE